MNIYILAAGQGTRLKSKYPNTPKPLVPCGQKLLIEHATDSAIEVFPEAQVNFVIQQTDVLKSDLKELIAKKYLNSAFVHLPTFTRGAAESAAQALKISKPKSGPLIFIDCDIKFQIENEQLNRILLNDPDGIIFTFKSDSPNYSYVNLDNESNILGTVEKQVVSNDAITGIYYFKSSAQFWSAYNVVEQTHKSELFLSLIQNEMIKQGRNLLICPVKLNYSLGTIAEIEHYELNNF